MLGDVARHSEGVVMQQLQDKIKILRTKMGWSQEDLARHIDVSLSTVQRWEHREAKPMRLARRALDRLFKKAGIGEKDAE